MWQSPSRSQRLGSCGDECLRTYTCSSVIDTAAYSMISPFNTLAYTKRCSLRCVRFSLSCFVVGWRDAFLTEHCSLLNHVVVFCLSLRRNCGLKRPSPPSPRTRNGTEDAIKMHAPTKPTTAAITIQMSTCVSEITSDNSLLKTAGQRSIHLGVILPQINSTYQVFREKCFYSAMSDFYTDPILALPQQGSPIWWPPHVTREAVV